MATEPPDAFLSYTRFDDEHDGGAISQFRLRLASAVRAVTGKPFEIFQDVEGIGIGEHWPGKLDQMLNHTRFFIPIVTPSYLTSRACREEPGKFLRAETKRGRDDLVLPIYYIESNVLENDDLRTADRLATILRERQHQDWRELRFETFDAKDVRRALERLAREIGKARQDAKKPLCAPAERNIAAPRVSLLLAPPGIAKLLSQGVPQTTSRKQTVKVGTIFRDTEAPWCPEMVVIPPGEFRMGSTEPERRWAVRDGAERARVDTERPQHRVTIPEPFAVGKYPVTRGQFAVFVEATAHDMSGDCTIYDGNKWESNSSDWCSPGFEQTDEHPVVCVSWEDAKAYVAWLSEETSQFYRLLSEAEWEYACRVGKATWYSWGEYGPNRDRANFGTFLGGTTEVGLYPPNPWGLHDMHGNVMEWVEDCWNETYEGAPDDSRAWTSGDCEARVLRGGFWGSGPWHLRCASRYKARSDYRSSLSGFRVARML